MLHAVLPFLLKALYGRDFSCLFYLVRWSYASIFDTQGQVRSMCIDHFKFAEKFLFLCNLWKQTLAPRPFPWTSYRNIKLYFTSIGQYWTQKKGSGSLTQEIFTVHVALLRPGVKYARSPIACCLSHLQRFVHEEVFFCFVFFSNIWVFSLPS